MMGFGAVAWRQRIECALRTKFIKGYELLTYGGKQRRPGGRRRLSAFSHPCTSAALGIPGNAGVPDTRRPARNAIIPPHRLGKFCGLRGTAVIAGGADHGVGAGARAGKEVLRAPEQRPVVWRGAVLADRSRDHAALALLMSEAPQPDRAVSAETKAGGLIETEWLDLRCRGVRNANAYILVYDICCVESFEYVKMIRQQIVEHREGSSQEVPILVVGSKRDLQRQRFTPRRAVSVLVKKTWKCGYVECSAKFNWHVTLLFKELLGISVSRGMRQNHTSIRLQGALQRNRCSVM
ncbi:hypothetical protein COCON_G00160810 [Conger conger]|uniref:Small monomeric GTPase n=1 Tax=Conger conger TaxID=82655 RepID=A0A9Q1DAP2_CONCO|nr:hypothetical protein COCON_G00160810 [Conger conger]